VPWRQALPWQRNITQQHGRPIHITPPLTSIVATLSRQQFALLGTCKPLRFFSIYFGSKFSLGFTRVEVTDIGNMIIHSFRSLSCDRSIASSKASSPYSRSSASLFNLQYLRFSLRSYSSCLYLLRRLPVLSIFPSKTCFKRQFLSQDVTNPFRLPSFHCT